MIKAMAAALALVSTSAGAEVLSSSPGGFHVRHAIDLQVPPQRAYEAFARIDQWWDGSHSYSGSAANMRLSLLPGGCFCEMLAEGGGVEHMRVAFVAPGEKVLLTGSLGPLLSEATVGAMDVRFEDTAGGSRIVLDYKVAGFATGNAEGFAKPVDEVLGIQLRRLRALAQDGAINP